MTRVTLALLCAWALLLEAQPPAPMSAAAAQVAARISSLLPPRATVSLELQNLTALPLAEWSSFRGSLQDDLVKTGLTTAATQPDSRVRVTLSEDPRGLLLVAEVITGDNRQVAMMPWSLPSVAQPTPQIKLTTKLLWSQTDPILDILMTPEADSRMFVLSLNQLVSYRMAAGKWAPAVTASLALFRPMPRDPRGRLEISADGLHIYLPVETCEGAFQPQLKLTCSNETKPWSTAQVHWVAERNTLASDAVKAPFYTTANSVFAMADGRAQDRSGQAVAGSENWGNDIAAVANPCSSGAPAIVATTASTGRDELRVYEIVGGQAIAASDALPLPGPVTALWSAQAGGEATLVVRNSQTGDYEAFRLGLACAR